MWPWANGRQRRQAWPREEGIAPACLLVGQASARNFSDSPKKPEVSVLSLTSQARSVRVYVPRRAMHASCDSPCHLSAKHCLLRTCLPRTAPFRSMLLTLRGGPQCLAPRAHGVPVYPKVSRHSFREL